MFLLLITELARPILSSIKEHNKSDMEVFVESKRPSNVAEAEYWMRQYEYKINDLTPATLSVQTPRFAFLSNAFVAIFNNLKEAIIAAKIAKAQMIVNGTRGS